MSEPRSREQSGTALAGVPAVPGARLAVRVLRGAQQRNRDFFDIHPLTDGRLALAIGRVPDQTTPRLTQATADRLRGALTVQLLDGASVVAAIEALHRYAEFMTDAQGATACLLLFDPQTSRLHCATAGHPGALVLDGQGGVRRLVTNRSGPLATAGLADEGAGKEADERTEQLGRDEIVLLHSAEVARLLSTVDGRRQLAGVVADASDAGPEELCRLLAEGLDQSAVFGDVVLLALAPTDGRPEPLGMVTAARAGQLSVLRHELDEWLRGIGLAADDAFALQLAAGEACANAVEHAYRSVDGRPVEGGVIELTAAAQQDGTIMVRVSDRGRWLRPQVRSHGRGRGLLIMRECVDQVRIDRTPVGTTITLRKIPRRAVTAESLAGVGTSDARTEAGEPGFGYEVDVLTQGGRVCVRVRGQLPQRAAASLRRTLLTAARGGALPLVVDLTEVGEVIEGAVYALLAVAEAAEAVGYRLTVVAPAGSAAREGLALAGVHALADIVNEPPEAASPFVVYGE